ncbi:MAG: TonB-dependent receptor [candidate division KSB1 bacterium]|nr:TonB-dependent receptor [candidate division KSB1 bacterium]
MLCPWGGLAETGRLGTIRGQVLDGSTGSPLPGANVMLAGTPYGAATDEEGEFVIPRVHPGRYTVVVRMMGYKRSEQEVVLRPGDSVTILFRLQPFALELGQVVVTASRLEQDIREAPATVHAISAGELARYNASTVGSILRYLPGVQVAGSNISIRGSSGFSGGLGSRVLLLVDGIPFLTPDQGDIDWDVIPLVAIRQVEVLKGPGSAVYGSNAMGGVVNIRPAFPGEERQVLLRTITGVYDQPSHRSWRWSQRTRYFGSAFVDYQQRLGPVGIALTAGWKEDMSYKENDDSKGWVFTGLGRWSIGPNAVLDLIGGMKKAESGSFVYWRNLNHALNIGNEPLTSYTRTIEESAYLFPVLTRVLSDRSYYRLRLRWREIHTEDWRVPRPGAPVRLPREKYRGSDGSTLGAEWQFNTRPSVLTDLVFGIDLDRASVESIQYGKRSVADVSVYAQVEHRPTFPLRTSLGVRWDEQLSAGGRSMVGQLNPKLGVTYQLREEGILRASVSRGFRAPSIAEKFISTVASNIRIIPNPDLRPERNWSAEIGYNHTMGAFLNLDASVFASRYADLIEPQLVPGLLQVQFRNVARARIFGSELVARAEIWPKRLRARLGYTYLDTKDLSMLPDGTPSPDHGKPLKYRSRNNLVSSLDATIGPFFAVADFRYLSKVESVDRITNIPDMDKQVPTYVLDLRAGWKSRRLSLEAALENALQYYYVVSPGNLGPLRNFSLQLQWLL